jgi:hypothetical protein
LEWQGSTLANCLIFGLHLSHYDEVTRRSEKDGVKR